MGNPKKEMASKYYICILFRLWGSGKKNSLPSFIVFF